MSVDIYGIDTETYTVGGTGLLSIQIYGDGIEKYIAVDNEIIDFDDEDIREILLDEFIFLLDDLKNDSIFYFFNLSFDFSQMERYLVTKYELADTWTLKKGQMQIIQSPQKVYSVRFRTYGGRMVYFHDLYNLTNTSLDKSAKTFVGEGKIEMENMNFMKMVPSEYDREYAMKDAELTYRLALALKNIRGFDLTTKLTIGARSLELFKKVIRQRGGYVDIAGTSCPIEGPPAKDIWTHYGYGEEDLQTFEDLLRPSLRGGICQAFRTGIYKDCVHIDIHSAHPSQMRKKVPYGRALDNPPKGSYTSVVFPVGYFMLKENGLKMLQFGNRANCLRYRYITDLKPAEYCEDFYLDGSYGIWRDEYDLMLTQYDFEGYIKEKYFSVKTDKRLKALMDTLYHGKSTSPGAERTVYKYLLNSLYGKFLTRPTGETIEYDFDDGGKVTRKRTTDRGRKSVNLPLGSWISTQTRVQLISTALKVKDKEKNLLYCDTDSLIFGRYDGWEKDIPIEDRIGGWGLESRPEKVNIVGAKTYQELIDGRTATKCAGLSNSISAKIPFGDLKEGYETMRLKAERDKDTLAISLVERPFIVSSKPNIYRGGH